MVPDYYRRVGLRRTATRVEIELAYGRARKQYALHCVGSLAPVLPAAIEEAFRVLLDPQAKATYDRSLAESRDDLATTHAPEIEPVSIFRSFAHVEPSLRDILSHIKDNFRPIRLRAIPRPRSLTMEIVLTPREAAGGGVIPVEVPTYRACPECGGSGLTGFRPCGSCDTEGLLPSFVMVQIDYPRGMADGAVLRRNLRHLGILNLELVFVIRIAERIPLY